MLNLEIWHSNERVLAFVLSRTNFTFLAFWTSAFVILVFLSLLRLAIDLRAATGSKLSRTWARNSVSDMSCVKTFTHLGIDALLQKLLPALGDLDVYLPLLLCFGSIWGGSSCTKHSIVFLRLLLFVGGVTAGLSIRWRLLGVTLAHHYDSLNVASLSHCLLMSHRQMLVWLILDLPGSAISLEMMLLNVNRLLLFVRILLAADKVFVWACKGWLQCGA